MQQHFGIVASFAWTKRAVPALTLAIVTLGINFLGDGLNDALNPRSKRSI